MGVKLLKEMLEQAVKAKGFFALEAKALSSLIIRKKLIYYISQHNYFHMNPAMSERSLEFVYLVFKV